jgi:hypothetical protein
MEICDLIIENSQSLIVISEKFAGLKILHVIG